MRDRRDGRRRLRRGFGLVLAAPKREGGNRPPSLLGGGVSPINVALGETSEVSRFYAKLDQIPGWFAHEDLGHFSLLLGYQNMIQLSGDILEIGVYCGRSAVALGKYLKPGERLVLCDTFPGDYHEADSGPEVVWRNLSGLLPGLERETLEFCVMDSTELAFPPGRVFRFIHVDGGHSREVALGDLRMCAGLLAPDGVIAVDDYTNTDWPEVTEAVDAFLEDSPTFFVVCDPGGRGSRKVYLGRQR